MILDKTIRWNVDPEIQDAETYRYWQGISVWKRLCATSELSVQMYRMKGLPRDGERLPRHLARLEPRER
jgi:hypothetical protein